MDNRLYDNLLDLFQLLCSPDVNQSAVDYCDVFIRLSF